jgi:hypothetical protein
MVTAFPSISNAQLGPFIENGMGINTAMTRGRKHSSASTRFGYVFRSLFETGIILQNSYSKHVHFRKAGVGPYATLYPIRQNGLLPISVYVSGGYAFNWFLGDEADHLEDLGIELNSTTVMLELGIFRAINISGNIEFIPTASIDYLHNTFDMTGPVELAEEEGSVSFRLGISLLYRISSAVHIALMPLISSTGDGSRYGFSATLILPR